MTRLPEWIEKLKYNYDPELTGQLVTSLIIAWEALEGLTAESALRESIEDMQDAMRRIEELGKS